MNCVTEWKRRGALIEWEGKAYHIALTVKRGRSKSIDRVT